MPPTLAFATRDQAPTVYHLPVLCYPYLPTFLFILSKSAFPDEFEKGLLDSPKVVVEGVVLTRPEVLFCPPPGPQTRPSAEKPISSLPVLVSEADLQPRLNSGNKNRS